MSEIHIGPHTRDSGATHEVTHGPGDKHHTFDREIDLKSIVKWMLGLALVTLLCQVVVWWLIEGIERFDAKQDPELTPIQQEVRQPLPPAPRLQVAPNFHETNNLLNEGAVEQTDPKRAPDTRSDLEDMQILRETEDKVLATPSWINQGQGRLRVPIDVAMQVIASRGAVGVGVSGGQAAGTVTPEQMRQQLPAGTSPGLPGATVQMSRPQAPAQPNEQPAGTAPGQQQPASRPPASQEQ